MRKVKVVLSYDGTNFKGFQKQSHERSVQEQLEKVLTKMHKSYTRIEGSGRTDAHVHALGQVITFVTNLTLDEKSFKKALNALIDHDIYIHDVEFVDMDFHPRFSPKNKTYRYKINCGEYNCFEKNYCLQLNRSLNVALMQQASSYLLGVHNFISYCSNDESDDTVRRIDQITITQHGDYVVLEFTGNGFLRYMIRKIVGALIQVGLERIPPVRIEEILKKEKKEACKYKANPEGLYLLKVTY